MTIRFKAIGVTRDRRTGLQLESARLIEQQRLDLALESEWRRRVQENERRRVIYRVQNTPNMSRGLNLSAGCAR